MDIIIGKRGYGKTTKLIRRSSEENIYILTKDGLIAKRIAKMAKEMGLDIPYPVTVNEYFLGDRFKGSSIRRDGLLIDDADEVLKCIFDGIPIKEITITDNNDIDNCIRYLPKPEQKGE